MRHLQGYIDCARNEGLIFISVEHRSKHDFIVVQNAVGEVYRQPVSRGNVSDHSRLHKALRSNFRKHALSTRPHPGRCHGRALAA